MNYRSWTYDFWIVKRINSHIINIPRIDVVIIIQIDVKLSQNFRYDNKIDINVHVFNFLDGL